MSVLPALGEAKIIVPIFALGAADRAEFRALIVELFGGFTSMQVSGAWRDAAGKMQRDVSRQYMIAGKVDDALHTAHLLRLVAFVFDHSKEQAVYCRDFAGRVVIWPREAFEDAS